MLNGIKSLKRLEKSPTKNIFLKRKNKLKAATLTDFTLHIFSKITVVPDFLISKKSLETAQELCREIDIKDSIYIALAIELDLILLTRDKELYQGLKLKGFTKIELFDAFIDQISNKVD